MHALVAFAHCNLTSLATECCFSARPTLCLQGVLLGCVGGGLAALALRKPRVSQEEKVRAFGAIFSDAHGLRISEHAHANWFLGIGLQEAACEPRKKRTYLLVYVSHKETGVLTV
eukprot:1161026-Pelagomonas_calceolata.AAC.3